MRPIARGVESLDHPARKMQILRCKLPEELVSAGLFSVLFLCQAQITTAKMVYFEVLPGHPAVSLRAKAKSPGSNKNLTQGNCILNPHVVDCIYLYMISIRSTNIIVTSQIKVHQISRSSSSKHWS